MIDMQKVSKLVCDDIKFDKKLKKDVRVKFSWLAVEVYSHLNYLVSQPYSFRHWFGWLSFVFFGHYCYNFHNMEYGSEERVYNIYTKNDHLNLVNR
jgi:hypothetical protein